jgi:hypothetical protein
MYLDCEDQYGSCVLFSASSENEYCKGTRSLHAAMLVPQLMNLGKVSTHRNEHM